MKKEIKTIHGSGTYPGTFNYHSFSWEGSIIVYDNQYFEGIVRELKVDFDSKGEKVITKMAEKDHPEGFIAGYIIEDKAITFDKFPEAATPLDDIAFLSRYYWPSDNGSTSLANFAPIMPCGNCPSFYKSLYHNKDNGLDIDLFEKIKDSFPCEDDEIILFDSKIKSKIPKSAFHSSPLNSELEYTVNATTNGDYMGWCYIYIDIENSIKIPEDVIIDEQELEQKIEAFKNNMREFDMYLYKNISENKKEKYNRILERLIKNGLIEEQSQDKNYSDEKVQETGYPKKGLQKIKDRFKRVFKK